MPQEFIDAGDRVVVLAHLVGRGKSSGIAVERTWAYVWTLLNGNYAWRRTQTAPKRWAR